MLQKYFKGIYEGLLDLNGSVKAAFVLDSYNPSGLDKDDKFVSDILGIHEETKLNRINISLNLSLDVAGSNQGRFDVYGRSNPQITFSGSSTSALFKYIIFYKEVTDDSDSPVIAVITYSTNQTVSNTEDKFLSGSTTANSTFAISRYYHSGSYHHFGENYFRRLLKGEQHLTGSSAPEYKCAILMLNSTNAGSIIAYIRETDNLHLSDLGTPMTSFDGSTTFANNTAGYIDNSVVAHNVIAFENYTDDTLNRAGIRVSAGTSNFVLNTDFSTGNNYIQGIVVYDNTDPDPTKKDIVGVFFVSPSRISNTKAEIEMSGKSLFYIIPDTTF